jgi:uncharacterized integral membrane protein
MSPLAWIVAVALVLIALFAVADWTLLTAPASLNFLLFTVEGPFGLALFGAIVVFAALFAVYAVSVRTSALLETRRYVRDLEAQRKLAEDAEASRLTQLRAEVKQELAAVRAALDGARAEVINPCDRLEQGLAWQMRAGPRECGHSLDAWSWVPAEDN